MKVPNPHEAEQTGAPIQESAPKKHRFHGLDPYFTPETLSAKTEELLQALATTRRKRPALFDPAHAALLVLDMQAYFLEAASHACVPSAAAILPGVAALAQAFAARGLPVIYTRHVNTPQNAGQMAAWWRDLLAEEHPLSQISPAFDTAAGIVLPKSQYDAFYATPLEEHLRARGVAQVVICGVMTHLCCETTARAAFVRGFEVFFPVDGSATYNEDFHRATLLNLAHGFAHLVRLQTILDALP